mmetsp:Transcript_4197/g.14619  ORF Transcript_4197/g.14619 Transcript_4197/m.14619 type:complete len:203 (-) Transcript_4197:791-1399(-)
MERELPERDSDSDIRVRVRALGEVVVPLGEVQVLREPEPVLVHDAEVEHRLRVAVLARLAVHRRRLCLVHARPAPVVVRVPDVQEGVDVALVGGELVKVERSLSPVLRGVSKPAFEHVRRVRLRELDPHLRRARVHRERVFEPPVLVERVCQLHRSERRRPLRDRLEQVHAVLARDGDPEPREVHHCEVIRRHHVPLSRGEV